MARGVVGHHYPGAVLRSQPLGQARVIHTWDAERREANVPS